MSVIPAFLWRKREAETGELPEVGGPARLMCAETNDNRDTALHKEEGETDP